MLNLNLKREARDRKEKVQEDEIELTNLISTSERAFGPAGT